MGRWGEEESKSKGMGGCLFAAFVLGAICYTFYINYDSIENRRKLEKSMQNIVRSGIDKSAEQMIGEIHKAAEDLNVHLDPSDVHLETFYDDNNNPVVDVKIDYKFKINLLFTTFTQNVPIAEKVTIVVF